jgi:hypothetical protein
MRVRVMLVSLGLLAGSAAIWVAPPSAAGAKPLRAGTIEGGIGVIFAGEQPAGERSGCKYAAECLAWVRSGCNPALAGHDPVLTASIVEIGDLADGRTRRTFSTSVPPIPLYPGAVIQFWRGNCTEIPAAKRHTIGSTSTCAWAPYPNLRCPGLVIPRGATWMTVSGYWTTAHLEWTLT